MLQLLVVWALVVVAEGVLLLLLLLLEGALTLVPAPPWLPRRKGGRKEERWA